MCTLSWLIDEKGYQIFCNRDELKTRAIAKPVQLFVLNDVEVFMPVDAKGNGSWISTNEHGLSLSLLNYYQGSIVPNPAISRGQLLRSLSHLSSLEKLDEKIATEALSNYAPFRLIAFMQGNKEPQIRGYVWSGQDCSFFTPISPLTSSAVDFENVCKARKNAYASNLLRKTADEFKKFHSNHNSDFSHRGVCMHRDDAETVSFSHITVNEKEIQFSYQAGSPCKGGEGKSLHVVRSSRSIAKLKG